MAEEPWLPSVFSVPSPRCFTFNPRKRPSSPGFDSSDPAIFSSDDDPGLDNYVEGRQKKRYIGSWFHQQPAASSLGELPRPPAAKRRLARQLDSGVFLGSDDTDADDAPVDVPARPPGPPQPARRLSPAELEARDKVRQCLEQGCETIDLWALGLDDLSDDTLSPLATFSCIPVVAKDVAFEQKVPELKLYMAMNRLRRAPGTLFDLTHLTILSLRGNQLSKLPPAIARLVNLRELNVSQNHLSSLPAELLDLLRPGGNLRELAVHPNPFDEPDGPLAGDAPADDSHFSVTYLGRSPLQLSGSTGVVSEFKLPSGHAVQTVAVEPPGTAPDANGPRPSRVPSLVEASLRSCYGSSQLPDLHNYMPEGLPHLGSLLRRAAYQRDMGGVSCTQCKRLLIVPTIEWLQWHAVAKRTSSSPMPRSVSMASPSLRLLRSEAAVPFRYRACSWKYSPGPAAEQYAGC